MSVLAFTWFAGSPRVWAQENSPTQYQVKAAFLFEFAEFIDWPPGSFAGPDSPFVVCVVGEDPFGRVLDKYLLGKKIGDHPVQIGRIPNLKEKAHFRGCHIIFLSASVKPNLREAIDSFRGWNVLLVGDTRDFASSGGAIELTLQDNHVRFTINPDAAERAGLRVSSNLLSLAKIVHDAAGNGGS